jgi:hypothetical protein
MNGEDKAHAELMKTLENKRRNAMILIALVAVGFAVFILFVRPILRAYL